jgi:hypothetical protein
LSTSDVDTDLPSVVLHEAGHVLGIGHSDWATSTMTSGYVSGSVDARVLKADDIRAICDQMPPSDLPPVCDAEPLGGFSARCDDVSDGCCSMAPGQKPAGRGLLLVGALVFLKRHRPRRRCCRPIPTGAPLPPQTRCRCGWHGH